MTMHLSCMRFLIATTLCAVALLGGCTQAPSQPSKATAKFNRGYPIRATVTVGMVADLLREIGGDHVEVTQLLGSGVDPHLYKPTRDDVNQLMNADIVFFNGLMLEGKMAETLTRLGEKKRSVAVGERIAKERLGQDQTLHKHPDPHSGWMSASGAK